MASSMVIDRVIPQIPAWKKLGLKLKYARDEAEDELVDHIGPTASKSSKKRKRGAEEEDRPGIQRDTSRKTRRSSSASPIAATCQPTLQPPTATGKGNAKSGLAKRKSVSFTPETKVKDGESIKQLLTAWVEKEKDKDPSFDPEKTGAAFTIKDSASAKDASKTAREQPLTPKKKKKAKKKGPKAKSASKASTEAGANRPDGHPALTYLRQYHQSYEEWKFNKAKQSYLLKHLLDLDRIPLEYDKALCLYIGGLQGEAVRSRVMSSMEAVRSEPFVIRQDGDTLDETSASSPDLKRKRVEYEQALTAFVSGLGKRGPGALDDEDHLDLYPSDEDLARKMKRRKRAEIILWSLSRGENGSDKHQHHVNGVSFTNASHHSNGLTNGVHQNGNAKRGGTVPADDDVREEGSPPNKRINLKVKPGDERPARLKIRMRKLRTNAVDMEGYSSSSSSSSSDGGSDSSGSDSGTEGDSSTGDTSAESTAESESDAGSSSTNPASGSDQESNSDSGSDAEDSSSSASSSSGESGTSVSRDESMASSTASDGDTDDDASGV